MTFSEIIQSKIISPSDIEKRRNMWGFYNYRVAAVLVSEQAITSELVEAINAAADQAAILVVAAKGSRSFANVIASLHSVNSLVLAEDSADWLSSLRPDLLIEKIRLLDSLPFGGEVIQL